MELHLGLHSRSACLQSNLHPIPDPHLLDVHPWDAYEREIAVSEVDLVFGLQSFGDIPWADYLLNPRRLRGSDFLMRWSQGRWSEDRFREVVEGTRRYFALPYGPSGTAPSNDPRQFELYFEHLAAAGLDSIKRPDLLIFEATRREEVRDVLAAIEQLYPLPFSPSSRKEQYSGWERLSFVREEAPEMQHLLRTALLAVECENSLWIARQMPDYGKELRPMRRLGGKPGLPKDAVVPNIIIKDEDLARLENWQAAARVPIHVWHAFYDLAFGVALDEAKRLIAEGVIQPQGYTYQGPGGISDKKTIFQIHYHYAYAIGEARTPPSFKADQIIDKNGHVLPYVRFDGGELAVDDEVMQMLDDLSGAQP